MGRYSVLFQPLGVKIDVDKGSSILDAAFKADISLEHACGGSCSCTTCHIEVLSGFEYLNAISDDEDQKLDEVPKRTPQSRLSCQVEIGGDIVVRVPGLIF